MAVMRTQMTPPGEFYAQPLMQSVLINFHKRLKWVTYILQGILSVPQFVSRMMESSEDGGDDLDDSLSDILLDESSDEAERSVTILLFVLCMPA